MNQFKNILGIFPEEWKVPLTYRREARSTKSASGCVRCTAKRELAEMMAAPEKPAQRPPEKHAGTNSQTRSERPTAPRIGASPRTTLPAPNARRPRFRKSSRRCIVPKAGFANYYFNRLEQARVLHGLDSWAEHPSRSGWSISGTTASRQLRSSAC